MNRRPFNFKFLYRRSRNILLTFSIIDWRLTFRFFSKVKVRVGTDFNCAGSLLFL
mgnify:CR=1 FL=1